MQIAELRELFHIFDTDRDGMIRAPDLINLLQSLGQEATEQKVHDMIKVSPMRGDRWRNSVASTQGAEPAPVRLGGTETTVGVAWGLRPLRPRRAPHRGAGAPLHFLRVCEVIFSRRGRETPPGRLPTPALPSRVPTLLHRPLRTWTRTGTWRLISPSSWR